MLKINYQKRIDFPFDVVLGQYFDYEHIEHVHPDTLGEYRLLEKNGDTVVYEQIWPSNWLGKRKRSVVRQTFLPPDQTEFEFIEGLHKGTWVQTRLGDQGDWTLVDETYLMKLPNWPWLGRLIKPFVMKSVDKIWKEDLDVAVCRGGWPGVPGDDGTADPEQPPASLPRDMPLVHAGSGEPAHADDLVPDEGMLARCGEREIAVFKIGDDILTVSNKCPHTGGPLALGQICNREVVCPWHGARFDLKTGQAKSGPTTEPAETYAIRVDSSGQLYMIDAQDKY